MKTAKLTGHQSNARAANKAQGPYTIHVSQPSWWSVVETTKRDALAFARGQVKCGNGIKIIDANGKQIARVKRGNKWG